LNTGLVDEEADQILAVVEAGGKDRCFAMGMSHMLQADALVLGVFEGE
jgi:hypothetical protein